MPGWTVQSTHVRPDLDAPARHTQISGSETRAANVDPTSQAHRSVHAHHGRCRREAPPRLRVRQYRRFRPVPAAGRLPQRPSRGLSAPAFPGTRTAASRPSPMCWPARSSTATAWATRAGIAAGDVQWMTAGSGIIHQEMPQGDPRGRMHGFQLWANLPSSLKMTAPRYQDIPAIEIPETVDDDGTTVRVICGDFAGQARPGGRHRGRAPLSRHLRSSGPAQDLAGGNLAARFRLCVRGLRQLRRGFATVRRPD